MNTMWFMEMATAVALVVLVVVLIKRHRMGSTAKTD